MDYGKLKTYYESIDGVTVPFVYPQYWDKDNEEWVVVDKDNRLPVDARVTGSREEFIIRSFYNIAPEEEVSLDYVETLDYSSFYITIWKSGEGANLEVLKRERTSLATTTPGDVKVLEVPGAIGRTEPEELIGSTIRFRILNTGDATANTVHFVVYGIK